MNPSRYCAVLLSLFLTLTACTASSPSGPDAPTSATPTPTPGLPPLSLASTLGCGLPSLPDLHNTCPVREPQYIQDVRNAVDYVIAHNPELFDPSDPSRKVADHRGYTNAVVQRLRAVGYCAVDQLEEIAIKKSNDFNEQYNIWTSLGFVRSSYITTCFPAQF